MGEVYRARDPRLNRDVAIKVLPASLSAEPNRLRRFEQEARAAGMLNHPNVTLVHDVGAEGGAPYVVSELLEGDTLRAVLAGGRLSPRKAIDYASQIARGLSAAHEKGIVHRDLKPENLFVTRDGRVKILDFGLAKLTGPEEGAAPASRAPTEAAATEPGVVLGTVGYMSPEQVRGRPAGPQSDIFSLGAVLYEMISGRRAFRGESHADTMSGILTKDPPDLSLGNPEVPQGLERVVRRCLEKSPEERFDSARDLAFDLEALSEPGSPAAVSPAAAPNRSLRRILAAAAAVAALVALALLLRGRGGKIETLAVLPFVNASGDPGVEYLSDGMTESLINRLSRLPDLTVMSRSSVFRYKGRETDAQAAGRDLNVQAVLTGRVVQRGPDLSVSAELVDTQSNRHLWGEQYQRRTSDILAMQEQIVADISVALRRRLTAPEKQRIGKAPTDNTEAYGLYLKGRYHWSRRNSEDLRKSIEYFQKAVEKDPAYALAYTGLAEAYAAIPAYGFPPRDSLSKAKAAALKALEIDDRLAQAHVALAAAYEDLDWDFPATEREFLKAIEIDPKYPTAHHWYSIFLSYMGRTDEALREIERAHELDTASLVINVTWTVTNFYARRYDKALQTARETCDLDANFAGCHGWMGVVLEQRREYPEAISQLEEAVRHFGRNTAAVAALAHVYAVAGRRADALAIVQELKTKWPEQGYEPEANIALVEVGLGSNEEAFEWLEKAYRARSFWLMQLGLKGDGRWDPLRQDPRFADLLKRIGFPP
jgi:serine/threonine-protein kinase